jgi:hypothetical protein
MAAQNSTKHKSKKPTSAIDRTDHGLRGRTAQPAQFGPKTGDMCAPEPTPTTILLSHATRTEPTASTAVVRRDGGGWGWAGGVARAAKKGKKKQNEALDFVPLIRETAERS